MLPLLQLREMLMGIETRKPRIYLMSAESPGSDLSPYSSSLEDSRPSLGKEIARIGEALYIDMGEHVRDNFDRQTYENLPIDRDSVVDGKLATTIGPSIIRDIHGDTHDIISISLYCSSLLAAARRSFLRKKDLLPRMDPQGFFMMYKQILQCAEQDADMRERARSNIPAALSQVAVKQHIIDTSRTTIEESCMMIFNPRHDLSQVVPGWEIEALEANMVLADLEMDDLPLREVSDLARTLPVRGYGENIVTNTNILAGQNFVRYKEKLDKYGISVADTGYIVRSYESVQSDIDLLSVSLDSVAIEAIRSRIRESLVDLWAGLHMKSATRFMHNNGELVIDNATQQFSPAFYKIAAVWPAIREKLHNKIILDPFAGSGMMASIIAAKGTASKIYISDIEYGPNGYDAELNQQMWGLAFDGLPSWYHPDFAKVNNLGECDVRCGIPLPDRSVDYVVTDPPYGVNCKSGDIDQLYKCLPEIMRVSRNGAIMLIPGVWLKALQKRYDIVVKQLVGDASMQRADLQVFWVSISMADNGWVDLDI